jgi:hypothetical protein
MTCQESVEIYENMTCEIFLNVYNPSAVLMVDFLQELKTEGYFLSSNPYKFSRYFKTAGNFTFKLSVTTKRVFTQTFWVNVLDSNKKNNFNFIS